MIPGGASSNVDFSLVGVGVAAMGVVHVLLRTTIQIATVISEQRGMGKMS